MAHVVEPNVGHGEVCHCEVAETIRTISRLQLLLSVVAPCQIGRRHGPSVSGFRGRAHPFRKDL
jgi:hypothetical protein